MFKKAVEVLVVILVVLFSVLIILKSQICREGAFSGIVICGKVIIPSLFPFTVCVIFIMNSGVLEKLRFLDKFANKILGLDFYETSIVLLSFIGGYPIGAKILNSAAESGRISSERAGELLPFCVNAGPAFIVSAVGFGILNSEKIGYLLFVSHILSNILLLFLLAKKNQEAKKKVKIRKMGLVENFVMSVSQSAGSVISISSFVILFSVIISYLKVYSENLEFFNIVALIAEVTNAMTITRNIYLIAFLLGFSGICVWCQIISVANKFKINYFKFVLSRILHGLLSSGLMYVFLKVFKIYIPTGNFEIKYTYSTPVLTVSMFLMCIIFAISVVGKNYSGKIVEDIV